MKSLVQYLEESIKKLHNKQGIIVFDIDDTLLKSDSNIIKIYKKKPGEEEISLTTAEFANDTDAEDPKHKDWYDYRDFEDPDKIYKSIISGKPIIKNLRIMDSYINAGYKFCFLIARSNEIVVKNALDKFLRYKTSNGEMKKLNDNIFIKSMSHAINDPIKSYYGENDAEKKANVLKQLCNKYDKVVFVDDDEKNIKAAKKLNLSNLKIIKAQD